MKKSIVKLGVSLAAGLMIGSSAVGLTSIKADTVTYNLSDSELEDNTLPIDQSVDNNIVLDGPAANTRVGYSTAAKAVLKVWKKLPAPVRKAIGGYTGLDGFLRAIDHFTGTEWTVIYNACKYVGMSNDVAWWVTQTITLFI
ncbi:hypothetical protein [Lactobacillus terrae]|uniref:hypothetical protein n=1 Tax=Lactobacillus terrae TaxID=2269374 RepID=UPI000C1B6ECC|nr:hypothetical protein [Lactobacillus terrae]